MVRLTRLLLNLSIVLVVGGLSKIHASQVADDVYDFTSSSRFAWSVAYCLLLGIAAYGVGLPDLPRDRRSAFGSAVFATAMGALAMSIVQLVVGDALLPRFVVFGSALLLIPVFVVWSSVASGGRARAETDDRVLLVGSDEEGEVLRHELERAAERPASLVAVVKVDAAAGGGEALLDVAQERGATVVVLDRRAQGSDPVVAQVAALHERGTRVRTLSLFYDEWLGKLPVSELERVSLMFDIGEIHRVRYGRFKRVFDVGFGSLVAVGFCLLTPVVLVGNLVANRGPLFFRQPRVGKGGEPFEMLKFRTMTPSGTTAGNWTATDDPRVTGFGRLLRVTHLDEMPQAINILRGDLSLVGPRPEQPQYVATLSENLPFYDLRHLVRPGLTGWAQVKYGYGASDDETLEKLQYDFFYLRHQSLALDLRVVGRTLRTVVGRGGR